MLGVFPAFIWIFCETNCT